MTRVALVPLILALAACGGGGGEPRAPRAVAQTDGACPSPDPVRDGPLVDAIRLDDPAPLRAALARAPEDARAATALAIVTGRGAVDPDQAACFAPYLT